MVRIAIFAVLALLVLQSSAQYQRTWYYISDVRVDNVALEEYAAVWGMGARLTGQRHGDDIHCLIESVDTALVNGITGVPAKRHYKDIPEESKAILKPFVIHMGDPTNYTISHEPDDPVWSVNMKRGLVSVFMLMNTEEKDVTLHQQTHYGRCNVTHKVTDVDGNTKIERSINHETCEDSPAFGFGTKGWDPTIKEHKSVTVETTYTYLYNTTPEYLHLNQIETSSLVQYQSMPGARSIQRVEQTKRYYFEEQSTDVKTFKNIDVSKCTVKANLIFDFSNGYTGGRDESNPKKSGEVLIKNFNEEYDNFKEYFNTVPLKNIQAENDTHINVYDMYEVLNEMNKETLEKISTEIFSKEDNLYQHMFLSLLPYLGTEDSVKFVKELIENEDENLNDLLAIKILSTFPIYLEEHSEELLKELEPLLSLKVSNDQVKYAGILSFASVLEETYENEKIDKATFVKYANQYYKHFTEAEDYEVKMTYLLGLVNMKSKLAEESMFEICVNTEISYHLRTLAIYGFKPALKSHGSDVYKHFWPIVKNHTEHYEVRVAALDLLLYSDLSYEDFQTIINWYHDESENPEEQHLANYLYTTVQALENSTGYYEYLGDFATEAFETMKPIKNDRVWTTGNYRMAFTDEEANFGGAIQARLVANPNSNVINVGIFSIDTFAVSLNLGSYTAYIKTDGIPDIGFIFMFFNLRDADEPVQHLLDLIRKHGYKIKNFEEAHIEVVIFSDERVVFGMHIDKNNIDNYADNALFLDVVKLAVDYNSLSFPLEESTFIVSDLGTSIQFGHYMSDLASYELANLDKFFAAVFDSEEEVDSIEYNMKYRSMWTYSLFTESYNPLADTTADTYKYVKDEKLIDIPFSFNLTDYVFKWKHEKDSFNWIKDYVLGVYIEKEKLQSYCSYCPSIENLPVGDFEEKLMKSDAFGSMFGVTFNLTASEKNEFQTKLEKDSLPAMYEIVNSHKTNSFEVPFGKAILFVWHTVMYNTFINKDLHKVSLRSVPYWDEPTETVFDLNFDMNDIKNDKDPISGEEFDFTVALTNRKCHNAEVLTYVNLTSVYKTKSEAPEGEAQPHIEHSYDVKIFFDDGTDDKFKVCIDREVLYPNRRVDKFSLDPLDPTKASTNIGFGKVKKISDECPTSQTVTVTEIYTATEKQKQYMESLEEHGKCMKQSKGLKYIPPTVDCLEAHKVISQYDACNVYVDLTKLDDIPKQLLEASKSEFGLKLLEYNRLNTTHITVSLTKEFLSMHSAGFVDVIEEKTANAIEDPNELMSLNPTVVAYDDHALSVGVNSVCYITPNEIQTFHGKVINGYHTEVGQDAVAFVECINETQSGLTIQRIGDHNVGFNFWSESNTLVASAHEGKVKVVYNGKKVSETDIQNDDFKIYFLDQDVIYVTNGLVDIQYTTEYISVKAPSIYNNYICGLCTGDKK